VLDAGHINGVADPGESPIDASPPFVTSPCISHVLHS
jgi:hypothetical protein